MAKSLNIALIRHGKTASNLRGAFTGKRDEGLSKYAADDFEGKAYPVAELLFSSPMLRCIETARLIYPEMEPIIIDGLRERDFGDFEGKTHADIILIPGFSEWGMNAQGMIFPGGEDFEPFLRRATGAFKDVLEKISSTGADNSAIVCHGGVIMAILSALALPKREYFSWQCKNGEGYILQYDRDTGGVSVKGSICE